MLTNAQKTTLKAYILADPVLAPMASGPTTDIGGLADALNAASTFVAWKKTVSAVEVGQSFDAASLDAMTAGNADKLSNFRNWNDTIYPNRSDHRAFFDGVFSPASGAQTRANLYALWRRFATLAEKVLATGTGTDASPGDTTFDGTLSIQDVRDVLGI